MVDGQRHNPAALQPSNGPGTRCTWGCVGPKAERMRKILPPRWFDSRTVQPVPNRYTDWAIRARNNWHVHVKFCILLALHNSLMLKYDSPEWSTMRKTTKKINSENEKYVLYNYYTFRMQFWKYSCLTTLIIMEIYLVTLFEVFSTIILAWHKNRPAKENKILCQKICLFPIIWFHFPSNKSSKDSFSYNQGSGQHLSSERSAIPVL